MDTDWRNDIVDQILKIDFFEIRKYFKLNWCDAIISKQKNIWRYIKKFYDWPMIGRCQFVKMSTEKDNRLFQTFGHIIRGRRLAGMVPNQMLRQPECQLEWCLILSNQNANIVPNCTANNCTVNKPNLVWAQQVKMLPGTKILSHILPTPLPMDHCSRCRLQYSAFHWA